MGAVHNLIVCSFLFGFAFAKDDLVKLKFEKSGIVPDVIDVAPNDLLEITFPSSLKVDLGNEITPTQAKDIPSLNWNADSNALYTVLLTDPDAPPHIREFRHWMVVNIPGNDVSNGNEVYEYIPPGAPKGTGLHRYIFLVFKQSNSIKVEKHFSNTSRDGRIKNYARNLIKEYNFGAPVAGNYYLAQWDEYVPVVQAQLGGPPPPPPTV